MNGCVAFVFDLYGVLMCCMEEYLYLSSVALNRLVERCM